MPWPTELRFVRAARTLEVDFDDGESFRLPYELLRVESPSAEVQGHGGHQKQTVPGKRNVDIRGAVPTGNYAVRLQFDDGHDSGIFSWDYLRRLGREKDAIWNRYLESLKENGLTREA